MNTKTRANATTSNNAAYEYLKARVDEVLASVGLTEAYPWWTPLIPRGATMILSEEESYLFGRQCAYAYGVPPWLMDPIYNTRAERWRWRWHRLTRPWRWLKRKLRGFTHRH